nr:hypothetical protein [Actinophytocola sp.]
MASTSSQSKVIGPLLATMRNTAGVEALSTISGLATRYCPTSITNVLPEPGSALEMTRRGVT